MDRFQRLTISISHIQKTIQRIKTQHMSSIGMKGSHAICISCMIHHPEGLTAAELSKLSELDKAAISRILKDLQNDGYVFCKETSVKKYRAKNFLTEKGKEMAKNVSFRIDASVNAGKNAISDEELEEFYRILSALTDNLDSFSEKLSQIKALDEKETKE